MHLKRCNLSMMFKRISVLSQYYIWQFCWWHGCHNFCFIVWIRYSIRFHMMCSKHLQTYALWHACTIRIYILVLYIYPAHLKTLFTKCMYSQNILNIRRWNMFMKHAGKGKPTIGIVLLCDTNHWPLPPVDGYFTSWSERHSEWPRLDRWQMMEGKENCIIPVIQVLAGIQWFVTVAT